MSASFSDIHTFNWIIAVLPANRRDERFNLIELRVTHSVLFDTLFGRDDMDAGGNAKTFEFFAAHRSPHPSSTTTLQPLIIASISWVDCFCVQEPFEKIRFLLRKDSPDLCRQFPGIGNTRACDEDQWTVVSNFSHLMAIFIEPGNNPSIIFFSLLLLLHFSRIQRFQNNHFSMGKEN